MALPSDLIDLLAEFAASGVEYLLVGGQALALHGLPRFTKDADVWLRDSPENIERSQQALVRFGAPSSVVEALTTAEALDVEELIRLKRASGRPQDLLDADRFEA